MFFPFETAGNVILLYYCFFIEVNQQIGLVSYDCIFFVCVCVPFLDLETIAILPSINYY